MQIFSEQDDCPHLPDDDPLWQESSLFVWHDRTSGLGGFWRPNCAASAQLSQAVIGEIAK